MPRGIKDKEIKQGGIEVMPSNRMVLSSAVLTGMLALAGAAQCQRQPATRTLILDGGGQSAAVVTRFVELAGGPNAKIVYIPTAASELKLGEAIYNPDSGTKGETFPPFEREVKKLFGIDTVRFLHTRSPKEADSEGFVAALRSATGVWFSGGNAGRLAAAYLNTRTHRELVALLNRGGVIGGTSAGVIIQGSYTVRGRSDKPVLMAKGHESGFGFLRDVAVNPHLLVSHRENELVSVLDAHPRLLGIGIDHNSGVIVQGDRMEVLGEGKVLIYDNRKHGNNWYYWLKAGEVFDLRLRKVVPR